MAFVKNHNTTFSPRLQQKRLKTQVSNELMKTLKHSRASKIDNLEVGKLDQKLLSRIGLRAAASFSLMERRLRCKGQ